MSASQILEWFSLNSVNLTVTNILLVMMFGTIIAAIIFVTYRITYRGVSYNQNENISNVIVLLVTIVIMLMISSNIVISLGMVGALSIVRFRTAIKDPKDTIFIFWSIVEGLTVGALNFQLSIVTTIYIAIVIVAINFIGYSKDKYMLVLRAGKEFNINDFLLDLKNHTSDLLVKNKMETSNSTEFIIEVKVKKGIKIQDLNELGSAEHIHSMNWLIVNGENIG